MLFKPKCRGWRQRSLHPLVGLRPFSCGSTPISSIQGAFFVALVATNPWNGHIWEAQRRELSVVCLYIPSYTYLPIITSLIIYPPTPPIYLSVNLHSTYQPEKDSQKCFSRMIVRWCFPHIFPTYFPGFSTYVRHFSWGVARHYIYIYITRRCPKMGGPQNGGFIIIMDNPIKMDDLGVPRFLGNLQVLLTTGYSMVNRTFHWATFAVIPMLVGHLELRPTVVGAGKG